MVKQPKATLVSFTENPVATLYSLWHQSRSQEPLKTVGDVHALMRSKEGNELVRKTFEDIVTSALPILENINLVWVVEDMPIFLREQIVRHRVGTILSNTHGADIIPDVGASTWWSQSSRFIDVGDFFEKGRFYMPDTVEVSMKREAIFLSALETIQDAYKHLVELGVPLEDARGIIPLCMTHRMSWGMNLQTLRHVAGNRGCWLAQAGIWEPLIRSMIDEVCLKIDPIFRRLIDPPCYKQNKWQGCPYRIENQARVKGTDEHPPCPLYLTNHPEDAQSSAGEWQQVALGQWAAKTAQKNAEMVRRKLQYGGLWGRDAETGEVKHEGNS